MSSNTSCGFVGAILFAIGFLSGLIVQMQEPAEPTVQTWALVGSLEKDKSVTQHWVINPEGDWFIIPAAYQAWAAGIIEGETIVLPDSIGAWPQITTFKEQRSATVRFRRGGLVEFGGDAPSSRYFQQGTYFYASVR